MTREEIITMARQAGFEEHQAKFDTRFEPFAKLIAQHERKACAKMCDYVYENIVTDEHIKDMAFKIRARGQE